MITRRALLQGVPTLCCSAGLKSLGFPLFRGREHHVGVNGSDSNDGSPTNRLRTISAAAKRALPGDTVIVHQGTYRERIDPPRGGTSSTEPITYQAAPGEQVVITGAEVVRAWAQDRDDVWTVTLPNSFFGKFNPYADLIRGDWFEPLGRQHHTGAVYLNSEWLVEAASLQDVYKREGEIGLWFGRLTEESTQLWANFNGADPNRELAEINVRQSVFYPSKPGVNYITVRGFTLRCAATNWAPPTAEQVGLIGTHWSKGWVIEDNVVSHSVCSGISLGKYGDKYDNTSADSAEGYVKTIERATAQGWNKENIGHHIVRNNWISHCEQAGVVGSLGAIFSTVTGNVIHDIHVRRLFHGEEMAGIKIHAAIDTDISYNHIHNSYRGVWLDWMAQGTHVHRNVFHDNYSFDLFTEVDHGPFLIDHNLFLSRVSHLIDSSGGAYAHNLFCGSIIARQYDDRQTPFMRAHSTVIAGLHDNPGGDMRFYNNLFADGGTLAPYNESRQPCSFNGNVFLQGATPCSKETDPLLKPDFNADVSLTPTEPYVSVEMNLNQGWASERIRKLVTTDLLGIDQIPKLPFQMPDGSAICLDRDFTGKPRNAKNPFPGPFEVQRSGKQTFLLPRSQARA